MVEVEAGSMKIHFLSGSWIDTNNAFQSWIDGSYCGQLEG